jgi:hypothetical protein
VNITDRNPEQNDLVLMVDAYDVLYQPKPSANASRNSTPLVGLAVKPSKKAGLTVGHACHIVLKGSIKRFLFGMSRIIYHGLKQGNAKPKKPGQRHIYKRQDKLQRAKQT